MAERRRGLGQFLGQFFGEWRGDGGNFCDLPLGIRGRFPADPPFDVIIKCRDLTRLIRTAGYFFPTESGMNRVRSWKVTVHSWSCY